MREMTRRAFLRSSALVAAAVALSGALPSPARASGVSFVRGSAPPFLPQEYGASKLVMRKDTEITASGSIRRAQSIWGVDCIAYDVSGAAQARIARCGTDLDGDDIDVVLSFGNVRDRVQLNFLDGTSMEPIGVGKLLEWEVDGVPGETDLTITYLKSRTARPARCKLYGTFYDIDIWGGDVAGYLYGGREGFGILSSGVTVYIAEDALVRPDGDGVRVAEPIDGSAWGGTGGFDWRTAATIVAPGNSFSMRYTGSGCGMNFSFKGASTYPDPPVKSQKVIR